MVTRAAAFRAAFAVTLLVAAPGERAVAHPIHMSFTEIRFIESGKSLELSVRVFADDFQTAAARYSLARGLAHDVREFSYLHANIRIIGNGGPPISLVPCGVERTGDMLRFCLRARAISSGKKFRISNTLMTELFDDQVNVVQSITGNRRASRIFVGGDGWKAIP